MTSESSPVDDRDRAAVEQIRGAPLPQDWPPDALPVGTRVRVIKDPDWAGPWKLTFTGEISAMASPELVANPRARPGELAYWVTFDDPQFAYDGAGPYRKAQIWDRYLERL